MLRVVLLVLLCLSALGVLGAPAALPSVPLPVSSRQSLPARELRGYGTLAAEYVSYQGKQGRPSLLRIQCANADKAKIVHAKYFSDLHLLGPVQDETITVDKVTTPVTAVPGQGKIAAARDGAAVTVLAAESSDDLALLIRALRAFLKSTIEWNPSGQVPTFLDSWDKHGFRFYYRAWEVPTPDWGAAKKTEWKDYHVLGEFDFAKQVGAGMVFWAGQDMEDWAECFTNNYYWDWAARASARRGVPMVINTSSGATSWLHNRYRNETRQSAPQYLGGFYAPGEGWSSGRGDLSWCAEASADAEYSVLQQLVKAYAKEDMTLEYLEPHGELRHGEHEILLEYGPVADRSYRRYLQERYATPQAVSARWYGDAKRLQKWDDARVPELAYFLGFNAQALDLAGNWRIGYAPFRSDPKAPAIPGEEKDIEPGGDCFSADFDDSAWPTVTAPGHDIALFLSKQPAVFRRQFTVDANWRARHPRLWLYIFDLNRSPRYSTLPVSINGSKVGESVYNVGEHWGVLEVTKALRDGDNQIALRLPNGFLGYRIYLSPHEPVDYPYLGEKMNAQWADFIRWKAWTRREQVRCGFETIRGADPDRSVICMAPDAYSGEIKTLCEEYGGHFHNTGYMSGWWAEPLPMLMRGSDLPMTLEPGNHPHNVNELKSSMGHWLTEGVNAVHYFIHIGAVLWHPEIRAAFEENLPLFRTIGKTHIPKAEVAVLLSDDVDNLTGFPWGGKRGDNLPSGYVPTQLNMGLHKFYHMDAVSHRDFARGNADPYKVVIDANNSVMDPQLVQEIEGYVQRGGTFITFNHTGRHTPEKMDSWPISVLTGYKVLKVDFKGRKWSFIPGQTVLNEKNWTPNEQQGNGLALQAADPACRDILRWEDGTIAMGMRQVGKGTVITVGMTYPNNPKVYRALLEGLRVARIQGLCEDPAIQSAHAVTNNGLYDVWTLWNWNREKTVTVDLAFLPGFQPAACVEVKSGQPVAITRDANGSRVAGLTLTPLETRIFLTPRGAVTAAPLDWLTLQRGWWKGTTKPRGTLPEVKPKFALDLTGDWATRPLDEKDTADKTALAAPGIDDAAWVHRRLCVWAVPEEVSSRHVFARKRFTVPAGWKDGEIELWMQGWQNGIPTARLRVWLDGEEIKPFASLGPRIPGLPLTAKLPPGSAHLLALEVTAQGELTGLQGNAWLYYRPRPQARQELAGQWNMTNDGLVYHPKPAALPGPWDGMMARRMVAVDKAQAGRNVILHLETDHSSGITGAIVNGHWLTRHHHDIGARTDMNITPWVKFGADNEIILKRSGPGRTNLKGASLDFYTPGVWP
ncbi:MAG: type 1 glutamine amidotransferase family protein [Armatimonadota bacterium]